MIELVIGVVIVGIVAAWAFPAYNHSVKNKQLHVVRNELMTVLHTARKEAVTKRSNVVICPRSSVMHKCGSPSDWPRGWLLFFDRKKDGSVSNPSDLIIATDPVYSDVKITYTHKEIVFDRNGFVQDKSGIFAICDDRGDDFSRGVILSNTGTVQVAEDTAKDPDFIPEDRYGNNITCTI